MVTKREFNNIDDVETVVGSYMDDAIFAQCSFTKIDFVGYDEPIFFDCEFCDCVISDVCASFYRCNFYRCNFEDTTLFGSSNSFSNDNCKFTRCVCEHLFDSDFGFVSSCEGFVGNKFCPMEGSFIAYKKCIGMLREKYIVKLLIPETAKRVCADSFKCRASEAKVLEIQTIDGQKADVNTVYSFYDNYFDYRVGETVRVDNFDESSKRCGAGIHFFIDRNHAVNYRF